MKSFCFISLALAALVAPQMSAATQARFASFDYSGRDPYCAANEISAPGEFYNPVIAGWQSDPSIVGVDGNYYVVTSTFGYFPGVPIFHSTDLVNWRQIGNVLSRPSQLPGLRGQSLDKGGIYAPSISFNPADSTFYVVTTDVGRGHFYVTAKDPAGPWSDPVWLPSIDGIDPSIFFDDDGRSYIVYKEDTTGQPKWSNHRSLCIIDFDPVKGTTVGEPTKFVEEGVGPEERLGRDEGPHIFKKDGRYYLIAAEGGTGDFHSEVVYRADSVRGPYTRWSRNPMLTQRLLKPGRSNAVHCTGHVDVVQTPEGEWWGVFLGTRPTAGNGFSLLGRETFMLPVKWSRDGFPYMTQEKDTVALKLRREGVTFNREGAVTGCYSRHDDFTAPTPGPEWVSLRGSVADRMTTGRRGLTLECSPELSTGTGVPSYLGRRIAHHEWQASTVVDFKPGKGDAAGLLLVKNERRQLMFGVDAEGVFVRVDDKVVARAPLGKLAGKPLKLEIDCDGPQMVMKYGAEGAAMTQLGEPVDASRFSTERAGGFTGATVGLYAEHR